MTHKRKVYESDIEDYLEEREWDSVNKEAWWYIGRQITLPHGRLDMLFYDNQLLVVELKARPLKDRDVCQVLRYQSDIRKLVRNSWNRYRHDISRYAGKRFAGESREKVLEVFDDAFLRQWDIADRPLTCPVLIGSQAPEEVVAALSAVGGRVYTWRQTDGGFDFYREDMEIDPLSDNHAITASGWLDEYYRVVRESATLEASGIQELLIHKLFGDIAFTRYSRGYDSDKEAL